MAGQSANLSLQESKAMQDRTQCGENSQGKKVGGSPSSNPVENLAVMRKGK